MSKNLFKHIFADAPEYDFTFSYIEMLFQNAITAEHLIPQIEDNFSFETGKSSFYHDTTKLYFRKGEAMHNVWYVWQENAMKITKDL